jgi:hypothetical protein
MVTLVTKVTIVKADSGNLGNSTVMVMSVTKVTLATADTGNLGNSKADVSSQGNHSSG